MLNSVSILIQVCERASRVSQLPTPLEVKLNAIHRYYELGENIKYVSEDIGYSRTSIYQWQKSYLKEGTLGLMNRKNITPGILVEGSNVRYAIRNRHS